MMELYREIWNKYCSSVCSIRFLNGSDIEIAVFTGFRSGNFIFTTDLINRFQKAEFVEIRFVKHDGYSVFAQERLSLHDFNEQIITTCDQEIMGFAVISATDLNFEQVAPLILAENHPISIGDPLALMGFQFNTPSLAIKSGIVSAFIHRNHSRLIQFDGSVIWGNSGSPLIDLQSGEVIGILGHYLDKKHRSYEKIQEISNANIKMLEQALGKLDVSGVDPIQVLIAWEKQIQQLFADTYKTTGYGMGIALDYREIRQLLKSCGIDSSYRD